MDGVDQDNVLLLVREQDMLKRMENGQKLIEYLSLLEGNLKWDNVDRIIDSLSTYWISSSNFKVALLGLDIISLLVERLGDSFQSHYNTLQNALVDRLGDQKEQVRTASITLFTNIMEASASPQFVFERLAATFTHKVWRVREGMCGLLIETLNRFGARSLHLNKLVPYICKLLSDPNVQVRDIALSTLVEIYKHIGEKVRQDIMKRGLPPNRIAVILDRFDEVLNAGEMVTDEIETASVTSSGSFGSTGSTTVTSSSGIMKPPTSTIVLHSNRASSAAGRVVSSESRGSASASSDRISHSAVGRRSVAPAKLAVEAGAVDEDTFKEAMEKGLPKVHLYSQRDFDDTMTKIHNVISDEKKDWEERAKALKNMRAVLVAGGIEFDSFQQNLRMIEPALRFNARDLRSQVVREACLTIGLLSTMLKNRFDHTAEFLFPTLFNLVPNSVKIMATCGVTTIRIILKNTHSTRLIPILTGNCNSKSTPLRRKTFCFLDLILQEWSTNTLEKNLAVLTEAVRKGIMDADSEARADARKAWWGLHTHFPNEADKLFQTLTSSQQKMIQGQLTASSSTDSIPRSTSSDSHTSISKRTRTSLLPPQRVSTAGRTTTANKFLRSRSDIDPSAAKRSSVKAMSYTSIGRTRPSAYSTVNSKTPDRKGRPIARPATSQRSQSAQRFAGSRSNSPNSKMRYYNATRTPGRPPRMQTMSAEDNSDYGGYPTRVSHYNPSVQGYSNGPQRVPQRTPPSSPTTTPQRSRIPVSTSRSGSRVGSRTGSRVGSPSGSRGASPPRYRGRGSTSGGTGQAMRVLPKGREGEQVLTDALLGRKTPKRRGESYGYSDDGDDFSDTSSVCSDRSSSYQSRNGVRRPHSHTEDIADILTLCQSSNWADRKEGLLSLHILIKKEKLISRMEMKKILEIFNRMFADPHGKGTKRVFSLFLEILPDFVSTYKEHIEDWLYVLMTQLLKKMGADLLGSVQAKVVKAMNTTRVSFPAQQQFNILTRYIVDQTQTPNFKVKVALLHYLMDLIALMEPSDISSTSETRLAITRIITWTTEPKSQDVRKASEAVVIDLFELNPGEFTMMLRILPKTFQDGAMKVLQHHMKSNGELRSPSQPTNPGRVTARIGMSPSGTVVSPHGSISGLADIMSPRGSDIDFTSSENTRLDSVEENLNFGEITAEIHKLRLDSSADGMDYTLKQKNSMNNITGAGDGNSLPQVCFPPPFQQLQNTPKQLSGNRGNNKYNPGIYYDNSPSLYNKEALKEAVFDDDDTISDEYSQDDSAILSQLTQALKKKSQRKLALLDFRKALRSGDPRLVLSGKSYQWEHHIVPLLMHIIDCMRDEEAETRVLALSILKEMFLRISVENFSDYIETIICTVLEAHKDKNSEVTRAAEDTATTLGSFLPSDLCFQVLIPFMGSNHFQTMQIAIKMLTNAINKSNKIELTPNIVNSLVPYLIKGYDSSESSMRKAAVFCLVALHQVIGEDELARHLSSLSGSKMKLLQLYIKRAQASGH